MSQGDAVDFIKGFLSGVKIFKNLDERVIASMADSMISCGVQKSELLIEKINPENICCS